MNRRQTGQGRIIPTLVFGAIAGLGLLILAFSSAYIVDEGRVAVITTWGKAESQEGPAGLKFKKPVVTGVREFDVRERALTARLESATFDQLPSTVDISVNWRPDPERILDIFVQYGSPDEFAKNTIQPRLEQSLKATIGTFTGAQMTREREKVAAAMLERTQRILSSYPAIISSVQIENFTLPARYMEAVLQKQEQAEATEKEQLRLEQQNIQAQQAVQTAEAEKEAAQKRADGEAYSIEVRAEADAKAELLRADAAAKGALMTAQAEAEGIERIESALSNNPLLVEYQRVKNWNGQLPMTVLGDQPTMMMELPK